MANLFLNWGDLGPYGTTLFDGTPVSVDTGGVSVDIAFNAEDAYATAFTFDQEGYIGASRYLNPNSFLKLYDDSNDDSDPSTSNVVLTFTGDGETYTDQVQGVTFKINDIDFSALNGDLDNTDGGGFQDIVTVNAYDIDGNPVAVNLVPVGTVSETGQTLTGTTEGDFVNPSGSVFVQISSPVHRIEILYGNGGVAQQAVTISDVHFSTVDIVDGGNGAPVAVDDLGSTALDTAVTIDVQGNDSDPDGDPLTTTAASSPANGSVVVNGDGTITYTPNSGFSGTDSFDYTVTDGNGGTDSATVTVNVGGGGGGSGNGAPMAQNDSEATLVDTPITIFVQSNDSDPDGDPLATTGATTPANGSVVVNGDGSITYTPNAGFMGTDSFDYTISDGNGGFDTATVTVVVDDGSNTPPVAFDDTETTTVATPVTLDPTLNDLDAEDPTSALTVLSVGTPANGTAVLNGNGTVTYTPNPGFTGTDSFTYELRDTGGLGDQGTVTVTVNPPANTAPDAIDDSASTYIDAPVVIDVLGNDTDPESDPLTTTTATTPANGAVAVNPDGTITYTPNAGFTGTDSFDYTITDGNGGTDTATVTVTVDPALNSDPDAVDDSVTTPLDTAVTIDVLGNDTDPESDPLSTTSATTPTSGAVVVNGDGTVTYTPNAGFTGTDTFDYTISDGNGGTDTATVTVSVGGGGGGSGNGAPRAVDDLDNTPINTPVVISDPAANDTDPDGDPLTVTAVGTPTNGTAVLNGDGTVTYTPNTDFVGTDVIPYTVTDGNGGTDTGQIIVTVTPADFGRIDTDIFPVDPTLQDQDPFDGLDEDPDPSDDLDDYTGTAGVDVVNTGDDNDTITTGDGNDIVNPGIDNDWVDLGAGNDVLVDPQGADTIFGGAGNDTIIAGVDTFSNYEGDDPFFPTLGFLSDPNTDDGRDYVEGNDGNDSILTGDDDDTIDGGSGDDTIDGGIDDDLILGGTGMDSLIGGHGSDTIDGGADDDYIDGSAPAALELTDDIDVNTLNDRDSLIGGDGNDTLLGGDDDDTLSGGTGNDLLDGGIDEDSLDGGDGSDTLIGGQGADTLNGGAGMDSISGGADRDVIVVGSAEEGIGDTVDGGAAGDDYDILDMSGAGVRGTDWRIVDTSVDSNGNGIDGTVEYLNAAGDVTGTMDFFEIEEVVPCFTPGTLIATPQGERLVEDLQVGDRVITRDNGIQEIRWVGRKDLTGFDLARKPHFRPILIQKGALGNNLPEHDMLVSPNHRILVANDKTALYFEEREVLVAAKHLTGLDGVDEVESLGVSYIHIMFENHEVILSNGAWTESFQPGDYTLKGIGAAQREEIYELFPELEQAEGLKAYGAARRSLKKHEAQLLTR
ncbi:Ig-like domain-containing protein [Tropicibacter sp. S64]|uniref:Ig-like domain-containing protein n=1 Tax=Tropicibacter sp. S64 TaxID=3415122 RepID=UPI003C7C04AE